MSNIQEEALARIRISTNTNTEEVNHEAIFDAVLMTLDSKISKDRFLSYFESKISAISTRFTNNHIEQIYTEYNWLYDYLYINRSKLK